MRWERPLFVHLEVERGAVARLVPDGLTVDAEGERAVVSLVALVAVGPAPWPVTATPLRALVRYHQLNVRTYVHGAQGPGLAFLDTRVSRLWPLSARALGWPYRHDGKLAYEADAKGVALRAKGIAIKGLPAPEPGEVGDERRWLDRFLSYGALPGGLPYAVRVAHAPWRVRAVAIDPELRLDLGPVGTGRLLSAQLAESVDVSFEEVVPARERSGGRWRALFERAALSLVRTSP